MKSIEPYPRSWRDQWNRTNRWYARLESTAEGRLHDTDSLNYEDEMYAFFESCFHVKDWLKNDPTNPVLGTDVEDLVANSDALRLCADIANGSKHLVAGQRPRVDPKAGIGRRKFELKLGNETPTTISARYHIVAAGQTRDAKALANSCLDEWKQYLSRKDLLA